MQEFYKYVATGNDFVIFNNWDKGIHLTQAQIVAICDRRFGVGADGILLLEADPIADFRMVYYNADGSRGEMCGNGARSLVKFAALMGKVGNTGSFIADDGAHSFNILEDKVEVEIIVSDSLHTSSIPQEEACFINTGVPHLIVPTTDIAGLDLDKLGNAMNDHEAHPQGVNTNIVEKSETLVQVRTWERGVNTETLACGTGAAAVAIYANQIWNSSWPIHLKFRGGDLEVDYRGNQYWLKGKVELVFSGQITLS